MDGLKKDIVFVDACIFIREQYFKKDNRLNTLVHLHEAGLLDFISTDYWNAGQYALWEEWEARLFRRTMEQTKCCYLRLLYYSWRVKYKFDLNRRTIYDVCRGHDFLSAMSKMLIDNAHYSERWLTFFMTREMTIEDICSMQLYQNIDKWATSEGITMLVH